MPKVKDPHPKNSLLPYLNSLNGNFYLKLSLTTQDPAILEKTSIPFLVITDSDPLAQLVSGQLVTDTGSVVKDVFLLVQKDHYRLSRDELWPMNNREVNHFWQKVFSFYAGEHKNSFMVIDNQIDENGAFTPLQSLFFCRTTKAFFHPPCPNCGLSLHQCENDDLLIHSGLQPYGTSLKRYLYCPACFPEGHSDFYTYELDHSDPPGLKDRWALIREFGLLPKNINDQFPCSICPNHQECYGTDQRILQRIHPFSFYPFYMLIFEAMSLNGLDFLSLISGATFDEIEAQLEVKRELGRMSYLKALQREGTTKVPFLFDHHEKYFLEVFYLKLSFLGEVLQNLLLRTDSFNHPDLRLSVDRIWVKLGIPHGLLPFFWNFKVGILGLSSHLPESSGLLKPPISYNLFFLSLVWFYVLLGNKKHDMSSISASLRELQEHSFSDQDFSDPFFHPVNIFWDPEGKTFNKEWLPLWKRSLLLGWSLIKASFQYDAKWSKEEFWKQFENLRKEVKANLFAKEPLESSPVRPSEISTEDEAIHSILTRILKKWQTGIDAEKEGPMETVLLSSRNLKETPPPSFMGEKEIPPDTVMIVPPKTDLASKEKGTGKEMDRLAFSRESDASLQEDDFSAETVILGSGKDVSSLSRKTPSKDLRLEKEAFPSEEAKREATPKTQEKPSDDDFLAETIFLVPQKAKPKGKNGKKG